MAMEQTGHEREGLSRRDFERLSAFIHTEAGIMLGPEKKLMLEARVRRRLKALEIESYGAYCTYLFQRANTRDEVVHLIDVVTTNKTDFFREPRHFDFLMARALQEFVRGASGQPFRIWSAGCSTGEEPYTMAMLLSEFARMQPCFRFRILATDISTAVLEKARLAVYSQEEAAPIPLELKKRYLLRSRDPQSPCVRVVPGLRAVVEFRRLNFMDGDYGVAEQMDAIFCRNVIIYFNRATQEAILQKLVQHLSPGGYLFVGHAEALQEMKLSVEPVAPSLYRKLDARS
jgi:chemotaxis protein methyltransferase CheR